MIKMKLITHENILVISIKMEYMGCHFLESVIKISVHI